MKNYEEQQLEKMRTQLEEQPIPEHALDEAIRTGLNKARSKRKKKRRSIWLSVVAAIFLVGFVTSVRISPAFANVMASIPGFSAIIEMIQSDKGIEDIVKNDYFEELNISAVQDDLTFTLNGVIADESGMVISYTLEADHDIQDLHITMVDFYQNGEGLEAGWSFDTHNPGPTKRIEQTIAVTASNSINYDNPNFELKLAINNPEQTTFNIPFTLTKEIKKSVTYPIEQTIKIDGQKLTVHELTISPLRAWITLSPDEGNTMQILNIEHIQLIDENGEEWGSILNGVSGIGGNYDATRTLFIQSNYFRTPKKLSLKFDRIQALPKGENYIEIDFDSKKVISQPANWPMTISDITGGSFKATIPNSKTFHHQLFGEVINANGQIVESSLSSFSFSRDDENMYFEQYFSFNNIVNPIKIYIDSYPNYLDGDATVKIDLQ